MVFIIGEASIIPCYALHAIDESLRSILEADALFGGEIILIRRDFRIILPVVPRAPPAAVVDICLI